ncbi:hypothetical protein ACIPL1_27785 [Pseudomonas sp. NPDC090202]|uniref:hypothetical protein n=1 Tax=Pseudomonas sp. NPDC090202 TaxID=3364476 RepID=UPI00380C2AF0
MIETPYEPLPEPGDILWCRIPLTEKPGEPGPKCRPALVLKVAPEDKAVLVAYGTTKRTSQDELYPGEFALDPSDGGFAVSGLTLRTKFDLARTVKLPFNSTWFGPAPGVHANTPLPKMGVLHPSYMRAANAAYQQVA